MKNNYSLVAVILLVVLTIIWGSSFILMKLGMFDGNGKPLLRPEQVAGLRISIACIVLLPFAVYYIRKVPRNKLLSIFGVGFFGNAIPAFLFTFSEGENGISSSLAGMLNATTPIFAVIIGISVFKLKLKPVNYIGLFLGFVGTAGLMLGKGTSNLFTEWQHIAMVLIATFCYGISVNLIRYKLTGIHPVAIASISFSFIGVPIMIWLLQQNTIETIHTSYAHVGALGYTVILAVVGTALAVIMFNYLVQITNAVFASTVTYLMPVMAIIWGIIFKEYFTFWYVVSIVVILAGVYLTNKR